MLIALKQEMISANLIRYIKIGRQGLAGKAEDERRCMGGGAHN